MYNRGTPLEFKALEDVSFSVAAGGFLGILGGTGSGKTTLIKNLNGLLRPTTGRVSINGRDTKSFGPGLARKVGVVFQRPERQLFEDTVFRDVSFVLRRFSGLSQREIREKARLALLQVGLDLDEMGGRSPRSLSDGEKRKVAIAGILVNEPEVLVLDEPGVGLDPPSVADLIEVLEQMKTAGERTIVVVSHDMGAFLPLLDHMVVLNHGRMAAFGAPDDACRSLREDPNMTEMLPEIAVLVHDLRSAGCSIPPNEFRIPILARELAKLAGVAGS